MFKKYWWILLLVLLTLIVITLKVVRIDNIPLSTLLSQGLHAIPLSTRREISIQTWKRPPGPPKIGLQVGHWKTNELPEELAIFRKSTGALSGGKTESEVAYTIATMSASLLQSQGYVVDILPATLPEDYYADVFISIHADGSTDSSKTGFKAAAPYTDHSDITKDLLGILYQEYSTATGLPQSTNITRNMRGYYSFAWWRFDHTIHPKTRAVILEMGYLTNPSDRKILINSPEKVASGVATAVTKFINKYLPQ